MEINEYWDGYRGWDKAEMYIVFSSFPYPILKLGITDSHTFWEDKYLIIVHYS